MITSLLWLMTSCNKDAAKTGTDPDPVTPPPPKENPIPQQKVKGSVQGIVFDKDHRPVAGANVSCGGVSVTTDANGAFLLSDVDMIKAATVVTVKKAGYFNGIRTFTANATGALQYIQIGLSERKKAGAFDAATGGAVAIPGAEVTFASNQVIGPDKKPYTGQVNVMMAPIAPGDPHFYDNMPGDFRGIDTGNAIVKLAAYGMVTLELEGQDGQRLQLDGKQGASLKINIPASLATSAPAKIPLWYFDEAIGIWREEGRAEKVGNSYIGTVKHFTTWNCSVSFDPHNFYNLTMKFEDDNGIPIPYSMVRFVYNGGSNIIGYTDEFGGATVLMDGAATITVELYDNGALLYSRQAGPITADTDLGTIRIPIPGRKYIQVGGLLLNCQNQRTSGFVNAFVDGIIHRARTYNNGQFLVTIPRTTTDSASVSLVGVDSVSNKKSTVTKLRLVPATIPYEYSLIACEKLLLSFFDVTVNDSIHFRFRQDSNNMVYTFWDDRRTERAWHASLWSQETTLHHKSATMEFEHLEQGTWRPLGVYIQLDPLWFKEYREALEMRDMHYTVMQSTGPGQYLEGTVFGTMYNYQPNNYDTTVIANVTATFRFQLIQK